MAREKLIFATWTPGRYAFVGQAGEVDEKPLCLKEHLRES